MLRTSAENMRTPYDPSVPIEQLFKRINAAQDLATDTRNPCQEAQLVRIAYNLIFHMAVLNDACKEWRRLPNANKIWGHFKLHFANACTELQEMQSAAQELNYGTGIVNHADTMDLIGIREQTADALQSLTTATSNDRHD
eukprot:15339819-Ditylum_brightwellii.AAC.1